MNQSLLNILSYQNCSQYHVDSTISFTGKERDEETGYSYFGARYYDDDLLTGRLNVDPMADKYPSMSPYNYCAWNPVKLVDLDGNEIWIVINSDIHNAPRVKWTRNGLFNEDGTRYLGDCEFVYQTSMALTAIYTDVESGFLLDIYMGAEYNMDIIKNDNTEFCATMGEINNERFLLPTQSIHFNPTLGLAQCKPDAEDVEYLAPFLCLLHEFGHAYNAATDFKSFQERKEVENNQYDNEEEQYVIEMYEHPAAARSGMLQRTSHSRNYLGLSRTETEGPLSALPIKK